MCAYDLIRLTTQHARASSSNTFHVHPDWLDFYNAQLEEILGAPVEGGVHCLEFEKGANDLHAYVPKKCRDFFELKPLTGAHLPDIRRNAIKREFMIRMQIQLNEWIGSLEILSLEILKDSEAKLITSFPPDLMRLLRLQLDTAMTLLAPQRLVLVLQPVAVPLLQSQIQFTEYLDQSSSRLEVLEADIAQQAASAAQEDLSALSPERLSSTANDLVRMSGMIASYRDELESKLSKNKIKAPTASEGISVQEALEKFDDVSREYLELAFKTTGLLSRTIMQDILPTITKAVGGADWEASGGELFVQTVVTTLDDYFQDVEVWCDDYLFPRLLRACMEEILNAYIKQLAAQPQDFAADDEGADTEQKSAASKSSLARKALGAASSSSMKWRKAVGAVRKNIPTTKPQGPKVETPECSIAPVLEADADASVPQDSADLPLFPSNREKLGELLSLSEVTPFASSASAAARIEADCEALAAFFDSKYGDELMASGLREGAVAFLRPLTCVAKIISAKNASLAEEHTREFLRAIKQGGLRMMPSGTTAFNRVASRTVTAYWARKGVDMASRREYESMTMRLLLGGTS